MKIVEIGVIALTGTVLSGILKEYRKEYAVYVSLSCALVIFMMMLGVFDNTMAVLEKWQKELSFGSCYIPLIMKILGIAYAADFTAQICADAGESAIGSKVELAGKILIFCLTIPVMTSVIDMIQTILPPG